jgi:DNA-binding transcriptional LysR family regulator
MDRLDAMAVFVGVAEAGSLSGAARQLSVPLATVSRKLADLEAHLATTLIARSTRKLALTDAGREYLAACRDILGRVEEAEKGAAGAYAAPKGQLVVAAPVVFGRLHATPVVSAFLQAHSEMNVRLLLGDRNVNLLDDQVDIALRIGTLPDSSLIALPLGTVTRMTCSSPAYLEQHGTPAEPHELRRHACITFEGLMSATAWSFPVGGKTQRVPIRSRLSVTTADAAIAAARAGLGITRVLSYQVDEAIARGELVRILTDHEPAAVPASLVYSSQGRLPMKCRAFIDFAVPRLRQRLGTRTLRDGKVIEGRWKFLNARKS